MSAVVDVLWAEKYMEIGCRQFGPERLVKNWSPKSSVGVVTTLWADRRSPRSLIPDRLRVFFSPPVLRVQTAPGASCSVSNGIISSWIKRSGHEAGHSPVSSADVKN